ncbi:HeLo domain-containing protein [Fusarium sp. LHS14.1]|nr:HeLo domain-containing protein [Fusarium sp. LHS14.1]
MTLVVVPPRAGIAAIAGAIKACLDILSGICAIEALAKEWILLQDKLDVEKTLLLQWADKVKLLDENYDKCLIDTNNYNLIIHLLHTTHEMLTDKDGLMSHFSIVFHEQVDSLPAVTYLQSSSILSRERMERFNSEFTRQGLHARHVPDGTPSTTKILRVATSQLGFEKFIEDIRQTVNSLNRLASNPNCLNFAGQMAREDLETFKTVKELRRVREASKGVRDTIALSADERMVRMARRRIWANLRFDGMHDRRLILQDPHPGTFEWALKAPEPDTEWDSLTKWLESGSDIYWVCGKAGAGKSTFLKHIFNHPETKRRLSTWGGDEPVSLGSFFFWKLGRGMQRSRDGMARAVLYHILRAIPTLIPILVPTMWKFAYEEDVLGPHEILPLPSVPQVQDAFKKMAEPEVLNMKFCFVVDGLDEYGGDKARAVAILQLLCTSPKIKILASSRPHPVFEDLFANSPKLHLHQLVREDVLKYVQDKADTHRYMRALREVDETMALILVEKLAEKASGVFLWTVLATRILLQGFDGLERFVNLEQRIANIPEDLEDLFVHVLNLVEPCHRKQVANLLRSCYKSKTWRSQEGERGRRWSTGVPTVDHDKDFDDLDRQSERNLEARHRQCLVLENRLASRCGGLLEVIRSDVDGVAGDKCFCATPEDHPDHDTLIDSSIEFVHRTVYEWFGGLDSWALSQLDLPDKSASEDRISRSWEQSRLAQKNDTPFLFSDVKLSNNMHNVGNADKFSPEFADSMLCRIHELMDEVRRKRGLDWHTAFCCNPERDMSEHLEILFFAVAMGMVNFVKYFYEHNPEAMSLSEMETKWQMRWWRVATDRNLIRSLLEPFYETIQFLPPQGQMVEYLASSGCDVPDQGMTGYLKRGPDGSMEIVKSAI